MNPCKKCLVKAMCSETCDDLLSHINKIEDIKGFLKDFTMWGSSLIWCFGVPLGISLHLNTSFFVVFAIWIVFNAATFALALITQND